MAKVDQETNWRCYSCSRLGVNYVTLGIGELLLLILTVCSLAATFPRVRKTKLVSMVAKMGKCLYFTLCQLFCSRSFTKLLLLHMYTLRKGTVTLGQLFFISTVSNYLIITCSQRGYWLKNLICDLTLMGSYELHRNITWSKTLFVLWHWCLFVADVLQEVGGFLDVDWSHALGQKHMGHGGHICSHHGCDRWHGTTARRSCYCH